jgi:hypothetical protein
MVPEAKGPAGGEQRPAPRSDVFAAESVEQIGELQRRVDALEADLKQPESEGVDPTRIDLKDVRRRLDVLQAELTGGAR